MINLFQALANAPGQQMSLNDIYTWFTDSFAFYRNNPHSWKVLSLWEILFFIECCAAQPPFEKSLNNILEIFDK